MIQKSKNLLTTFGELKSLGFKDVIVQPTHLFHMEQFTDLTQYVNAIKSIDTVREKWKSFNKIVGSLQTIQEINEAYLSIIFDVRLPRIPTCASVGVALSSDNLVLSGIIVAAILSSGISVSVTDVIGFIGLIEKKRLILKYKQ